MNKITRWLERPRYCVAENAQGDLVGVLIPLPMESYQSNVTPLKSNARGLKRDAGKPIELWFKNYHGPGPDGAA